MRGLGDDDDIAVCFCEGLINRLIRSRLRGFGVVPLMVVRLSKDHISVVASREECSYECEIVLKGYRVGDRQVRI